MRVIAGSARGRPLRTLPGSALRPTADRVREALFSSLTLDIPGARVLDLFAGSGALGIEALSRGAREAVFVESHPKAVVVIAENLARTRLADRGRVTREDAWRFCRQPQPEPFDVVLADPPYRTPLTRVWDALADLVAAGGVAPDATIVIERDRRDEGLAARRGDAGLASPPRPVLAVKAQRRYGDTLLLYCHRTG